MSERPPPARRLLAELRRRGVFRAAAAYGAAAFVVLQAADLLVAGLGLPSWPLRVVTVLVLVGFPAALLVAWAYETTPEGVRATAPVTSRELEALAAQPASGRWTAALLGLAGGALLAAGAWWALRPPAGREGDLDSIAVLPFVNMSGEAENQYFGDGLAEELGAVLVQIEGLRVAARTSAFSFRGRSEDVRGIGEALGVASVLEGSVRRAGGQVRVTAQLVRTSDGFPLWSERWERELTASNVFDIQDEIAAAIAGALARRLRPGAEAALADRRTGDLEAYDLYLLGRHRWATRTPQGLREAIAYYEDALALDSGFALAWAGLSDAWEALPFHDPGVGRHEAYGRARPAADRALALAPDLAEANAASGVIAFFYEHAWEEAEARLARAIARNPSYAPALDWRCILLTVLGRPAEGLPHCERAREVDPFGLFPNHQLVGPLSALGREEEIPGVLDRVIELHPGFPWAHHERALHLIGSGRGGEAAEPLARAAALLGVRDPGRLRAVARAAADPAARAGAAEELRALEAEGALDAMTLASLRIAIGDREGALRLLDVARERREVFLPFLSFQRWWDPLRTDPRFAALVTEMGLPNGSPAYRAGLGT